MTQSERKGSVFLRLSLVLTAAVALQGCAVSQLTSGLGGNLFGSSSSKPAETYAQTVSEERLLAAAKTDPDGLPNMATAAQGCPKFVVWPRDKHLTIYEKGKEGDGLSVRYRSEITKTARECQLIPGVVTVKYGFAGRILLGPKGRPGGPQTVPAIIHVTDKNRNKIKSERLNVPITMVNGQPMGYFSFVRRISFNLPPGSSPEHYKLFVAFDRKAAGAS